MKFSWKAALFAPLVFSILVGLASSTLPSKSLLYSFIFYFVFSAVALYFVTFVLFVPALFMISRSMKVTTRVIILAGVFISILAYIPFGWITYRASGPDSGPPSDTFMHYFMKIGVYELWPFLLGGLVTSSMYAFLTKFKPKK